MILTPPNLDDLLARLRAMGSHGHKPYPTHHINPDGHEAAEVIERLQAEIDEALQLAEGPSSLKDLAALAFERGCQAERLREALRQSEGAMRQMFRYYDGGETRGSYDGKPERNGLRKAWYAAYAALIVNQTEVAR